MTSRIVVVEDEPHLLEMIQAALEMEGFDVTGISRPALKTAAWYGPADLFLIDLVLPDTSGVELANWLRSNGSPRTPMIGFSACSSELRKALRARVFEAVLAKPFDLRELMDSIRGCLNRTGEPRAMLG